MNSSETVRLQSSFKTKIKRFFKETFRPHSKEEYAEFFGRGISQKEGVNGAYPWMYMRAFALLLALFAVSCLTYKIARYTVVYMTAVVIGGLTFNIPLLIFFYEIYPKKDLSLVSLLLTVLVGGALTSVIILLGYEFIYHADNANPWVAYLWTGFWEELVKMAVAVPAVLILKKKSPFACFLIGFAVGTGYSVFEDLGYIYSYSRTYTTGCMWLVLMTVGRGFSCICSHAPWTGVIMWAFAKFKKPFINFRFYGIVILSMLLHYLADVPFYAEEVAFLTGLNWGWAIEIFVVAAILTEMFLMLKNSFAETEKRTVPEYSFTNAQLLSQKANVVAGVGAVVLAVCALLGTALPIGYVDYKVSLSTKEGFVSYVQDGREENYANWYRLYNGEVPKYSSFIENGKVKAVTQVENVDGVNYFYVYEDNGSGLDLRSIGIVDGGVVKYCRRLMIYADHYFIDYGYPTVYDPVSSSAVVDEDKNQPSDNIVVEKPIEIVSYFQLCKTVKGVGYNDGKFILTFYTQVLDGLGYVIALSVLSGVTIVGSTAAFITLKIKSKGENNG